MNTLMLDYNLHQILMSNRKIMSFFNVVGCAIDWSYISYNASKTMLKKYTNTKQ
jgi:hypothetical protein